MTRLLSMTVSNSSEETVFASSATSTSVKMKVTAKDQMVFIIAIIYPRRASRFVRVRACLPRDHSR